jgi:hypothetical protein
MCDKASSWSLDSDSSLPCDVILGRDWFKLCSTGLSDNPDAAVRLSPLNQWLVFAASPVNAIHDQLLPSGKFLFLFFTVITFKF